MKRPKWAFLGQFLCLGLIDVKVDGRCLCDDVCQIQRRSLTILGGLSSKHDKSVDLKFILDIKHFVEVISHYILSAETSNKKNWVSVGACL